MWDSLGAQGDDIDCSLQTVATMQLHVIGLAICPRQRSSCGWGSDGRYRHISPASLGIHGGDIQNSAYMNEFPKMAFVILLNQKDSGGT